MAAARRTVIRLLAASAGLAACAAAGALWHYTRPGVQRELVLKALKEKGFSGDIVRVSLGLGGGFEVSGLDLTDAKGRRFKVGDASGELSLWDALCGEIHVLRLDASGVDANLTKRRRAGDKDDEDESGPSKPIGRLPSVRVDAADIEGSVSFAAGEPTRFNLRLREADTRKGATLAWNIAGAAAGTTVSGDATLSFAGAAPEKSETPLDLWKALTPTLRLQAEARTNPTSPVIASLRLEADGSGAVLTLKSGKGSANLRAEAEGARGVRLAGDWKLDRSALAAWTKAELPEFAASGSVKAAYDFEKKSVDATLSGAGQTERPQLATAGPDAFAFDAAFSGSGKGPWRIRKLHLEAGVARAPKALALDAADLTVFPKENWRVETSAGEAASLKLHGFPAAWLNPFLGDSGAAFVSGDFSGDLSLSRDASGAIAVRSAAPLSSSPIELRLPGRPALRELSVKLPVVATRDANGALTVVGKNLSVLVGAKALALGDVSWRAGSAGEGDLEAKLMLAPGALPAEFLPGGVCKFCADTGLTLSADAKASHGRTGGLSVSSARVEAVTKEGVRALSATLLKPLGAGARPPAGEPVVALAFKGAPLALANPLLRGPVLGGVAEAGDLVVSRTDSGWRVERPANGAAASVRGLSWRGADGVQLLAPTDTRGSIAWESTASGWKLSLDRASFENSRGRAAKGDFAMTFGDGIETADADLAFDLPALSASLPALAKALVESGSGTLKLKYAPRGESTADLGVADLGRTGVEGLFGLSAHARLSRDGSGFTFSAPATLSGPSGETKLTLDGSLSGEAGARRFGLTARGDRLYADDWKAFASAKSPEPVHTKEPSPAPGPTTTPAPDKVSFWNGYTGKASLSFGVVEFARERIDSPTVVVAATRERLATEKLSASWRGLPVNATATLDFKEGSAKPYRFDASGALERVPLGKVVASVSPKSAGWIDGDFSGKFSATGTAETAGALAGAVVCDADVRSENGTIRFFKADNEAVRVSGELAGIAGDLAGGLGKILGDKSPGISKALEGASVLQQALRTVNYKTLGLVVKRSPDGSLEIRTASVENDILKIAASGLLGPGTGAGFMDRNATIAASLSGRNLIADALRGVLGKAALQDGAWISSPELRYEGPLSNVKNNLLNNLLRSMSSPFVPGRGKNPERKPVEGDPAKSVDRILEGLGL